MLGRSTNGSPHSFPPNTVRPPATYREAEGACFQCDHSRTIPKGQINKICPTPITTFRYGDVFLTQCTVPKCEDIVKVAQVCGTPRLASLNQATRADELMPPSVLSSSRNISAGLYWRKFIVAETQVGRGRRNQRCNALRPSGHRAKEHRRLPGKERVNTGEERIGPTQMMQDPSNEGRKGKASNPSTCGS